MYVQIIDEIQNVLKQKLKYLLNPIVMMMDFVYKKPRVSTTMFRTFYDIW